MLISAGRVVTPARVFAPGWVLVDGDRIADVGPGSPPRAPDLDLPTATVVPGFVDAHVHGGGGASFDGGRADDAAAVARAHLAHGTTTMMASLVTDRVEGLAASVRELADVADDGVLAGIHLEGPWLSPMHAGAHDPALLTDPKPEQVEALLDAGRGHVRMVTLAPELPGGLDAIRRLTAAGVVAGDRPHRRDVRRRGRGARRRCHGRHAPVQRDARAAPPRAGTDRGAAGAPGRVRRAGRRRRARPPRGAAAGRERPSHT